MKNTKQHRTATTYQHVINVAMYSYLINKVIRANQNVSDLISGAFLHDYFLYDWRKQKSLKEKIKHGFKHPETALKNASNDFKLNDNVKNIIYQHMWPYTITKIPKCREAIIVMIADKLCAIEEFLGIGKKYIVINNRKQRFNMAEYLLNQLEITKS